MTPTYTNFIDLCDLGAIAVPAGFTPDRMPLGVTPVGPAWSEGHPTRPSYRLFALGNRPGLVAGGTGAIAGEVWAISAAAIGPLLAQVPAPLGFGAIALEHGPCRGFLAEAAGVEGAPDITALGGWRAYLALQR